MLSQFGRIYWEKSQEFVVLFHEKKMRYYLAMKKYLARVKAAIFYSCHVGRPVTSFIRCLTLRFCTNGCALASHVMIAVATTEGTECFFYMSWTSLLVGSVRRANSCSHFRSEVISEG